MSTVVPLKLDVVVRVVNEACTRHAIKQKWHNAGKLIDVLVAGSSTEVAVAQELQRWLSEYGDKGYTRSCFVRPFMRAYCLSRGEEYTTNDDHPPERNEAGRGRKRTARPKKR